MRIHRLPAIIVCYLALAIVAPARAADTTSTQSVDNNANFSWQMGFNSPVPYLPGEPVRLSITATNHTTQVQQLDFGAYGTGGFAFELIGPDSDKRAALHEPFEATGFSGADIRDVTPTSTTLKYVVLNHWISTQLPPGGYTVNGWHVTHRANFDPHTAPDFWTFISIATSDSLGLKKRLSVHEKMKSLVAQDVAKGRLKMTPALGFEARHFNEMLAYAEGPEAWPYQSLLIHDFGTDVMTLTSEVKADVITDRAAKLPSPEMARELIDLYNHHSDQRVQIAIQAAIDTMRASGREDVKLATDEFIKAHPDRPQILD